MIAVDKPNNENESCQNIHKGLKKEISSWTPGSMQVREIISDYLIQEIRMF